MNHRILRPVIAIIAAIAVAAAGVLIGLRLAAPASPRTITAPVLAPAVDDSTPSAAIGTATIARPGSVAKRTLDAGAQSRIDALNAGDGLSAPDAQAAVGRVQHAPAVHADDPCAVGAPATDCPAGLQGAIAADTISSPVALQLFASTIDHAGPVYRCPADTGHGGVGIAAITTVPADVTLRYWPQGDPTAVRTTVMHSQPGDAEGWASANAARGGYSDDFVQFQHCATLTGLSPTTYVLQATAIDVLLRISPSVPLQFDPRGDPTEPPMLVLPIGANQLYVSVPTYPNPLPDVRAWVVPDGTAPDCSSYTSATRLLQAAPEHILDVDHAALVAANYNPEYTKRVVNVFSAPEGSTIVVCARWFDHAGPTWNVTSPQKQEAVITRSPSAITPIVFFEAYHLDSAQPLYGFNVYATTQFGIHCGTNANFPSTAGQTGSHSGGGAQLCIQDDRVDSGTAGDVTITTDFQSGGRHASSSAVLPLAHQVCYGTCTLPPDTPYQVPITTDAGTVGFVRVLVRWQEGRQNGRTSWSIGTADPSAPTASTPADPRFDTTVAPVATLSSDGWSAGMSFTMRTDRHVSYRATLAGDCFLDGATSSATGETAGSGLVWSAPVSFSGLCPGALYVTTVEIVDDSGHSITVDINRHTQETWWGNGEVVMPANAIVISGSATAAQTGLTGRRAWDFLDATASFNSAYPDPLPIPSGCRPVSVLEIPASISRSTPQAHTVHVLVTARVKEEDLYFGVPHDADCSWPDPTVSTAVVDVVVPYTDLLRGMDITAPFRFTSDYGNVFPSPYQLTVHLTASIHPPSH
ncbi:MAG: hypothetical protein V4479_04605 [Actinomycetota bacterium]